MTSPRSIDTIASRLGERTRLGTCLIAPKASLGVSLTLGAIDWRILLSLALCKLRDVVVKVFGDQAPPVGVDE